VRLTIAIRTPLVSGGWSTAFLVDPYVNRRLGSYGPAVEQVCVNVLFPGSRARKAPGPSSGEFWKLVAQAPRVRFLRTKRRIDLTCLCREVSAKSVIADPHLTLAETTAMLNRVSAALQLIRSRLRPADAFDVDAFLRDAQDALAKCPRAIAKHLS
jgi:hypothetical protein